MKAWLSRLTQNAAKTTSPEVLAVVTAPKTPARLLIEAGQHLEDEGAPDAAILRYREAIALEPSLCSAWLNLGNAQQTLSQLAEAVESYRKALALDEKSAAAWLNLGNALLKRPAHTQKEYLSAIKESAAAYRKSLEIRPGWAEAWFGLGCALEVDRAPEEAIAAYERALEAEPDHQRAKFNLDDLTADHLMKRQQVTLARQVLLGTLKRWPDHRRLLSRLADLERDSGRLEEGLSYLKRLVEEQPDDFSVHSVFLFTLNYRVDMSPRELYEAHRFFGAVLEDGAAIVQTKVSKVPGRRLRIGYVSPDFRQHAVAIFIIPVLRNHDRAIVEVFCYYTHQGDDDITRTIRGLSDHWRDIAKLEDEAVAAQIVEDEIDVLIDLAGHTGEGRLPLFARRPAPVQMTWLGYIGTTGLSRMDYRICDAYTDPPGVAEQWHSEQLLRMPNSQWCYEPQRAVPVPGPLPYLSRGYWTFGSYNNGLKLNTKVFEAWAAVMRQFPRCRLKMFSIQNEEINQWVRVGLSKCGITTDRVDLMGRISIDEYFASADDVDIALDSFPYSGGTTTCDTLLMGLPVATVNGQRTIERSGVSLLHAVGLEDWIAPSPQALPEMLKRQLADPQRVAALRVGLPERLRASPLMDAPRFTKNLENHYHAAWERWRAAS